MQKRASSHIGMCMTLMSMAFHLSKDLSAKSLEFLGVMGDVLFEAFNTAAVFSYIQLIQEKQGFDAG